MATTTFIVSGMTCAHCVAAVTNEVAALPGVAAVDVDLASGSVTVQSADELDLDAVAAAVDNAGYDLVR